MYWAQFPATGDVGTSAGSLTEGVGQAAWRQGTAAQRRSSATNKNETCCEEYCTRLHTCGVRVRSYRKISLRRWLWMFSLDNIALLTGSVCFYCFRPNKSSSSPSLLCRACWCFWRCQSRWFCYREFCSLQPWGICEHTHRFGLHHLASLVRTA